MVTLLQPSNVDTPEQPPPPPHKSARARMHAHPPCDTEPSVSRAGGCSAPALMEGLTSAMLSYFHPPRNFQATRAKKKKKVGEKLRERGAWDSLQTSNSFHLASQFTESRDHLPCNEKVGWEREWSLLRKQPSALTAAFSNCQFEPVKMHSLWVITISCLHASTATGGGRPLIFRG